jgi:hypothetical protein
MVQHIYIQLVEWREGHDFFGDDNDNDNDDKHGVLLQTTSHRNSLQGDTPTAQICT